MITRVDRTDYEKFRGHGRVNKNWLYNPAFQIMQYGPGPFTFGANTFTVDRWRASRFGTAGATVTVVPESLGEPRKLKVQRNAGNASTQTIALTQVLSNAESAALAGKTVTFSCYVTAGADFSATNDLLTGEVFLGTGFEEDGGDFMISGSWSDSTILLAQFELSPRRNLFFKTFTVPENTTELGIGFIHVPTGTAGADDSFYIDSPKLEIAYGNTEFEVPNPVEEFKRCASYYEDMARDPYTGTDWLIVNGILFSNSIVAGEQLWIGIIQFQPKRNYTYTLTVGDADSWHITLVAGTSVYDLSVDFSGHYATDKLLLQVKYTEDGTHPAAPWNGYPGLLALDGGGVGTKFAISSEI